MGSLFVYCQQNGCQFSHLNNISVNIIDLNPRSTHHLRVLTYSFARS